MIYNICVRLTRAQLVIKCVLNYAEQAAFALFTRHTVYTCLHMNYTTKLSQAAHTHCSYYHSIV